MSSLSDMAVDVWKLAGTMLKNVFADTACRKTAG